jgi:K(+)-stimulated pyrophosphate-energized sodium pump
MRLLCLLEKDILDMTQHWTHYMEGIDQMDVLAILAAVTAFLVLVFAYSLSSWVGKKDEGTDRMKELSGFIREGAVTFLKREYKTMIPVILVLFLIIGLAIN